MAIERIALEKESVTIIRRALLNGLASYAEIERLANEQHVHEICGREVPEGLRVVHPTGAADTLVEFADAIRMLEYAERLDDNEKSERAHG
jgi:hypothetical protein